MIVDTSVAALLDDLRRVRADLAEQTACQIAAEAAVSVLTERMMRVRQALLYAIDAETEPPRTEEGEH